MGGRARQCGAAVAIPLDTEGDPSILERGRILQTTEDFVVLREGENSLRVVDAQAFCAGSIVVRHVVELPSNVTIAKRISVAKYGIAWNNGQEKDSGLSKSVYIVDFQTGEVSTEVVSALNEPIRDAFVDSRGKLIAVVGAATRQLYGRSQYDANEWIQVNGTELDARAVDTSSSGRFVSSVVMGNCFMYLRASLHSSGSVHVKRWIFDVDAGWTTLSFSSRILEASAIEGGSEGLKLFFVQDIWKFAILIFGNVVYHFQVDCDLRNSLVKRISLDHRAVSGTWIEQDAAFAILLENGQISIACRDINRFELLDISTSSTLSKRLRLSALLGKVVSTALQLVWFKQEKQIAVDFGSTCAVLKLEIVDEELSSNPPPEPKFYSTTAFVQGNRGGKASLDNPPSCYSEYIREISSTKSPPTSNELLNIARIIIARGRDTFEDEYFTLLSAIHQQLAAESLNTGMAQDPIDFIGKKLKLMEILISLTVSMELTILRQIGMKLMSTAPTRSDRKLHYRKEISQITHQVNRSMRGASDLEDWWVESFEVRSFLRVYFSTTCTLLHQINAESAQRHQRSVGAFQNTHSLCELVIAQEDEYTPEETISKADKGDGPLFDSVKRLLVSYTMMCRCLGVNGVSMDLEHLFSIDTHSLRKEVFCCFLKPWQCSIDTNSSVSYTAPNYMARAAVRYAGTAGALHHLFNFALASESPRVHSFLQDVFKTIAVFENEANPNCTLDVDTLHWQACEAYISEAMTISRRLGARRRFKYSNRETECSAGCYTFPFELDRDFNVCLQNLRGKVSGTSETLSTGSETSSLWEFSYLDKQLRERVVFLISRIVWHLEASSVEVTSLFKQAFAMDAFDLQHNSLSAGSETLCDSILKMRTEILQFEPEICLLKFPQSEDTPVRQSFRSKNIARSLMMLAWGLWIREKAAICTRSAHIIKGRGGSDIHANGSTGALVATCALHLDTLGAVNCDNEELLSVQLSLLEDASTMNAHKTATIVAWGFPAHKIITRHLKRYKNLRQIVQQALVSMTLEECEHNYQQLQKLIRKGFLHVQQGNQNRYEGPTHNGNSNNDIAMLVGCCCDREFLQIMSVLARCGCNIVATNCIASRDFSISEDAVQDQLERPAANISTDLSPSFGTESGPASIPTIEHLTEPQMTASLISRDEVIALLQAHTRHLEDKIHTVTIASAKDDHNRSTQSRSEDAQDTPTNETVAMCEGKFEGEKAASELVDVQRMARMSLQARDLNRRRGTSVSSDADVETNLSPKQFQRHDSVRNVLKLFRLRQENGGHIRSDQTDLTNESGIACANGDASASAKNKSGSDTRNPLTISAKDATLQRSAFKRNSSKKQRGGLSKSFPLKEPVYPLRLEYGTDNASLKLLGRSSQQRNPSLKRRQFIHQESGPPQQARDHRTKPTTTKFDVDRTDVVKLNTVSAQTNNILTPPASITKETQDPIDQSDDSGPEKASPVTQECDEDKTVARLPDAVREIVLQKGVGIQCRMTEDSSTNIARRRHGPPPLNIADKYPIWVDLDGESSGGNINRFKGRKKFLQVAQFGRDDPLTGAANNDIVEDIPYFTISPRHLNSEDGGEENQSESQHSPSPGNTEVHDENTTEQMTDAIQLKFRASYRQHYPVREHSGRINNDRDSSSGINTLIDLRDNMQQMTRRLQVLETCANSIDEQFKVSQKRLSRIGDTRPDGVSRVLEDIDEVLARTENSGSQANGRNPKTSLLSKKASSDLDAAKKLMETIEQLTISADDQ